MKGIPVPSLRTDPFPAAKLTLVIHWCWRLFVAMKNHSHDQIH